MNGFSLEKQSSSLPSVKAQRKGLVVFSTLFGGCAKQSLQPGFIPIHPFIHSSICPPTNTSSAVSQRIAASNFLTPVLYPVQIYPLCATLETGLNQPCSNYKSS
jgi:hypothetical protein